MNTTPVSLLERLRTSTDEEAWRRFADLYTSLLLAWARRLGLQPADAADLVQDVLVRLMRELPRFQYDPARKNFRGWLRTICFNLWRDRERARAARPNGAGDAGLANVAQLDDGLEDFWNHEHNVFLVRQALRLFDAMEADFEPQTLKACRQVVLHHRPPAEVAKELGLSANTVYIAKLRVLRRLRKELAEFLD